MQQFILKVIKKIWSNINFLFFNAARAIITPEGIRAVDKYNKNFIDSDFDYLNNLLNINSSTTKL